MSNIKKILSAILISLLFSFSSIVTAMEPSNDYVYVFHLKYNDGLLTLNENAYVPYDLSGEVYSEKTGNNYGEVVTFSRKKLATFKFNLENGLNDIKAPYFPDAAFVNFYSSSGMLMFNLSVAQSSVCNDDGKCDSNFGESADNCSNDCKLKIEEINSQANKSSGRLITFLVFVLAFFVSIFVVTSVYFYRKINK